MHDEELFRSLAKGLSDEAHQLLSNSPQKALTAVLGAKFVSSRRRRKLLTTLCVAVGLIGIVWNLRSRSEIEKISTGSQTPAAVVAQGLMTHGESFSRVQRDANKGTGLDVKEIGIPLSQTGQDGDLEFAADWYIPAEVEVIDSDSLFPAVRDAASRLLGLEFDLSNEKTI